MKILIVAGWMHPDAEGGSFRVVYEAGRRLAARGHEVHVATQRLDPLHPEEQVVEGIHVHRYQTTAKSGPRFYSSTLRSVKRMVTALQREVGFDVMHTHHPVSAFAALRARALKPVPVVATLHSIYFMEYLDRHVKEGARASPFHSAAAMALMALDQAIVSRSRRIIVLSEFMRRLLASFAPPAAAKTRKLSGGADLEAFRPEPPRGEARSRLRLPDDTPIFFTCRRLEHRMGLFELAEAAAILRDQGRRVLVVIAGRGSLEEALHERVRELRLEGDVRFVGYVPEDDLRLYYRAADCFVLPTRALEGFGLVTAEAFASGTPVLGTPVGATPELIAPFDPRLVMRDATADAIAEGMARFLDQVAPEPELERRCRAYAEAHFSWEPFVDGLEQLSREVAAL